MTVVLDMVYFAIRYIPWWAIPVIGMSLYFFRIYKLKDVHKAAIFFMVCGLIASLFLFYYIYAGGPELSVRYLRDFIENF